MKNKTGIPWVQDTLEQRVSALDAATRSRLNQQRHNILMDGGKQEHQGKSWLLPAGMLTVSLLTAVLVFSMRSSQTMAPSMLEDFELLASNDDLDLYNDMPFYQWLDTEYNDVDTP